MNIWSMAITWRRWASGRKWGGHEETTPGILSPQRVRISTRWESRLCSHQPPTGTNWRKPSGVMFWTRKPTSSMWPASITRGPSPAVSQKTEPLRSVDSSPQSSNSSTKIARTSSSWPGTAWASVNSCNRETALVRMPGSVQGSRAASSAKFQAYRPKHPWPLCHGIACLIWPF